MLRRHFLALPFAAAAMAQDNPSWTQSYPPHRVAKNLHYVGSRGLASYLITTDEGHILINSSLASSPDMIRGSVEKLGYKFSDVRILLISHAHWDHCAGSARVKELTAARYMVMDADVPEIEDGGKSNFHYGKDASTHYPPTKVDRVLHDGDTVRLGDTTLTARLTPGHTKGCTTWTTTVTENGRPLHVVIVGSPNVNPGYKLVDNDKYPDIVRDYEKTFAVLKSLPCDVFLGAHGAYFGLKAKYEKYKAGDADAFIDPQGYKAYVSERESAFRRELARQSAQR
jgi:metallo-beta-lactamase class B